MAATMNAVRIHRFGDADELIWEAAPKPEPGPGEVLIRTQAAGVNPIDWKSRSGGGASGFLGDFPIILGWELCGKVSISRDDRWRVGDEVIGLLNFPQPGACYAEWVVAKAEDLAPKPKNLSAVESAGLPLAGLTAWQALFETGHLANNERVLILAASGGVGHLAVQLGLSQGAQVIGTSSEANAEWLKSLGCHQVLDYNAPDYLQQAPPCDLVLDGVGGDTGIAALACLKEGGRMVTLPSVTAEKVTAAGQSQGKVVTAIRVHSDGQQLRELVQRVDQGFVKPKIERSFPAQSAAEAHQLSETGRARGKIVLEF